MSSLRVLVPSRARLFSTCASRCAPPTREAATAPFSSTLPSPSLRPLEETVPTDTPSPPPPSSPPPAPPIDVDAVPLPPPPKPEPTPAPEAVASLRRPVGGFRGGLIGFLLGSAVVGGYGYFALLEDYTAASKTLLLSVEELKGSTAELTAHLERIAKVEDDLARIEAKVAGTASKKELEGTKAEYRGLIQSEHLDFLALKAHLWGVEQDLQAMSKKASNHVRI